MNVSLPESMKTFIDEQVSDRGYGTASEYVRDLIRREKDREHLRRLLMEGANSPLGPEMNDDYFDKLRESVRGRKPR